jgi:hypothetical protein
MATSCHRTPVFREDSYFQALRWGARGRVAATDPLILAVQSRGPSPNRTRFGIEMGWSWGAALCQFEFTVVLLAPTRYSSDMSRPEKSDREQLLEARADILRQIEILQAGPSFNYRGGGNPQFEPVIADLTATLKEIDENLADLWESNNHVG